MKVSRENNNSKRIVLLLDIDDTITNETAFVIKNAPKYLKKKFGCCFEVVNKNGYDVSEIFNLKGFYLKMGIPNERIDDDIKKVNADFWNRNFIKYILCPLKPNVAQTIGRLRNDGCAIYFASLRGHKACEKENLFHREVRTVLVPFLTKFQLRINRIKYDGVFLVEEKGEKAIIAKQIRADFIFDDQVATLRMIDSSTIPVCIEALHNSSYACAQYNIRRIPFEYKSIMNIINYKIREMKK